MWRKILIWLLQQKHKGYNNWDKLTTKELFNLVFYGI